MYVFVLVGLSDFGVNIFLSSKGFRVILFGSLLAYHRNSSLFRVPQE